MLERAKKNPKIKFMVPYGIERPVSDASGLTGIIVKNVLGYSKTSSTLMKTATSSQLTTEKQKHPAFSQPVIFLIPSLDKQSRLQVWDAKLPFKLCVSLGSKTKK